MFYKIVPTFIKFTSMCSILTPTLHLNNLSTHVWKIEVNK